MELLDKSSHLATGLITTGCRLALLVLVFLCQPVFSSQPAIHIISSDSSQLYNSFLTTLSTELTTRLAAPVIKDINLEGLPASHMTIPDSGNLVITIGTHAARVVADLNLTIPVLHTLIPLSVYRDISGDYQNCRLDSAIYIDQPMERQVRLARHLFPQLEKYGLLLGATSINRSNEIDAIDKQDGLTFLTGIVTKADASMSTGRRLIRESELVIAVNDPIALNSTNAKWLLYTAYQQRKPVIGFSRAYVKAGAAAAVYSTPTQIARDTAKLVSRWYVSDLRCLPEPEFPRDFSVSINRAVSESLGGSLLVEDELLKLILQEERP